MTELYRQAPLERFTGLADDYDRYRPDYPDEAIDFIVTAATGTLVDVGCGTGISSRLFARRGVAVIGIEPNDSMRARAEATALPGLGYRAGRAEATGLEDGCAAAVVAAQSFHWFEPTAALEEFRRILKPGGCVFLMWNERDESDAGTADFGAVIRTGVNARAMEQGRQEAGRVLLTCPLFVEAGRREFVHRQSLDRDGLLGRAFSVSYARQDPDGIRRWQEALGVVFDRHQHKGRITLLYRTTVYHARRP